VLVERVENLASKSQWERAYDEIVNFERVLCTEGLVLVKFWLQISAAEQLKRFEARRDDPLKSWKLTDDDWRNREKRPEYELAVRDMLRHTDHRQAPWTLVSAESKAHARVAVTEAVVERLEHAMRAIGQDPLDAGGAL